QASREDLGERRLRELRRTRQKLAEVLGTESFVARIGRDEPERELREDLRVRTPPPCLDGASLGSQGVPMTVDPGERPQVGDSQRILDADASAGVAGDAQ